MKNQSLPLLLSLFVAFLHFGCGGAQAPTPAESGDSAGSEAPSAPAAEGAMVAAGTGGGEWEELLTHDDSLDQALRLSEVDCPSAHDLVQSICALAERVCGIAEDTADGETEERCTDGRSRCERAQDRTSNICP